MARGGICRVDSRITLYLLLAGGLLLAGVVATKTASRWGIPALVLFLALGMILGSDISGLVYFDDPFLAQFVGTAALVVILFEGGLQTRWKNLRPVIVPSITLATLGVVISAAVTGVLAMWVLRLDSWYTALLIGAIVGSTDAAAVFSVISGKSIKKRLSATLEAESGINDPMAIFLTILILSWAQGSGMAWWEAVLFLVQQMGLGLGLGLALGKGGAWGLQRLRMGASGLYPIFLFALAIFGFAATSWLGGSGFVAVYAMGVILGGAEIPYRQSILRFYEGQAWMAQMVMFIILGLLVFPRSLPEVIGPGLLLAAGLMFIARPISVWLCTLGMGFAFKEKVLLAWGGLRGAVPIVLATFPMVAGLPESDLIFNIVFFVVLTSALIHGATISPFASRLGLVEGLTAPKAMTLELVSMERVNADLIEVELPEGAAVVGCRLAELQLPAKITVSAILRGHQVVSPRGNTRLAAGDVLFILASKEQSPAVRALFDA